jgi:hypothetical protein
VPTSNSFGQQPNTPANDEARGNGRGKSPGGGIPWIFVRVIDLEPDDRHSYGDQRTLHTERCPLLQAGPATLPLLVWSLEAGREAEDEK